MNKKLKSVLIIVGLVAVAFVALAQVGKAKRNRNVESVCETRVGWQIGARKVTFREPVIEFVDSRKYLLYWKDLRIENTSGLMEPRKVMCVVTYDANGWEGEASFIDGEALR